MTGCAFCGEKQFQKLDEKTQSWRVCCDQVFNLLYGHESNHPSIIFDRKERNITWKKQNEKMLRI